MEAEDLAPSMARMTIRLCHTKHLAYMTALDELSRNTTEPARKLWTLIAAYIAAEG